LIELVLVLICITERVLGLLCMLITFYHCLFLS